MESPITCHRMSITRNYIPICIGLLVLLQVLPCLMVIPVWLQMIPTATALVYIGSILSKKKVVLDESMSSKDAALFPIIASASLFGLYIAYKYLSPVWVNTLISTYLQIGGIFACADILTPLFETYIPSTNTNVIAFERQISVVGRLKLSVTISNLLGASIGLTSSIIWFFTDNHLAHNFLGIMLSIEGISTISVGSIKTACCFLIGLFVYDIFWVFYTDVMVTVALNVKGPVKLLFPISPDAEAKKSLLGLGDIVVPGAVTAMVHRMESAFTNKIDRIFNFTIGKYFGAQLSFYAFGLCLTVMVMNVFNAAQPALFYLVPSALIALFGTAFLNGELSKIFNWSEEEEIKSKDE